MRRAVTLDDLIERYFADADDCGNAIPTHRGGTRAELLVDGANYFPRVWREIAATGPGDLVFHVGWIIDVEMAVNGRMLGDLLVEKAAAGVDVRLVLNGGLWMLQYGIGLPFAASAAAALDLRRRKLGGRFPLEGAVVMDSTGINVTRSQHQKSFLVRRGGVTTAWVGGMDPCPNRNDTSDHVHAGGWHDVAIELEGAAVADVWANFACRWNEAVSGFQIDMVPPRVLHPKPRLEPPAPGAVTPIAGHGEVAVQVLRSRYPHKVDTVTGRQPWSESPTGGIRQCYATIVKAIRAARQYIYFEDQFGGDSPCLEPAAAAYSLFGADGPLADRVRAGVKLIVLLPGATDGGKLMTSTVSSDLRALLRSLTPAQRASVAVWELRSTKVHTKLAIIDDEFCAIGSCNMQSRSMYGVDYELHAAVVDTIGQVRGWRMRLWAEHLDVLDELQAPIPELKAALESVPLALGAWNPAWLTVGRPGMWFDPGNPRGFASRRRLRLVWDSTMEVPA